MKRLSLLIIGLVVAVSACSSYQVKPLPFKEPSAYPNALRAAGAIVAAKAYDDPKEAKEAFGFDILGAGLMPVQVIFDNRGQKVLSINPGQTFLEDEKGNLWPILERSLAYERASKYVHTKRVFKEGAYHGVMAATAGAIIGAAIGIVTGENVAVAAGKGAAVGAAIGATGGGLSAYGSGEARHRVVADLRRKSLQNKEITPDTLAYGFIFFPAEAKGTKGLRLQLVDQDTGEVFTLRFQF